MRPGLRPAPHRAGLYSQRRLKMSAGLTDSDTMFSVRETPWHGLGAVLDRPPATVGEAIELRVSAGASRSGTWRSTAVLTCPMCCAIGASLVITPLPGKNNDEVLGVVGERYRIVQNRGASRSSNSCSQLDPLRRRQPARRPPRMGARNAARSRRGRRRRRTPYVLLMNSHDGSTA